MAKYSVTMPLISYVDIIIYDAISNEDATKKAEKLLRTELERSNWLLDHPQFHKLGYGIHVFVKPLLDEEPTAEQLNDNN